MEVYFNFHFRKWSITTRISIMKTVLPTRSHRFDATSYIYTRFQLSSHVGSADIFPTFQSCRFAVSKHRSYVSFEGETSLSFLPPLELYDLSRVITFDRAQSTFCIEPRNNASSHNCPKTMGADILFRAGEQPSVQLSRLSIYQVCLETCARSQTRIVRSWRLDLERVPRQNVGDRVNAP